MKTYKFKLVNGFDHFNQRNIFQVVGTNNEYIGEWDSNLENIRTELQDLKN